MTGKSIIAEKNGQCVIRISQDPGTSNIKNPALIDKSDVLLQYIMDIVISLGV